MKKPTNKIKSQMRELRAFVHFNYDLRKKIPPQSIAKIRKYSRELKRLKAYPTIKYYRPRAKSRIKAAKKIGILDAQIQKQFKVIPLADIPPTAKIKFVKGQLVGATEKLDTLQVPFDITKYLQNPEKYIEWFKKRYSQYNNFRLKCGESVVSGSFELNTMHFFLEQLTASPKQKMLTKTERNEVFHSIIAYRTKGQAKNTKEIAEKLNGLSHTWIEVPEKKLKPIHELVAKRYKKVKAKRKKKMKTGLVDKHGKTASCDLCDKSASKTAYFESKNKKRFKMFRLCVKHSGRTNLIFDKIQWYRK